MQGEEVDMIGVLVRTQWEVPAGEDEDDPERLRHHLRGRRPRDQRHPHLHTPATDTHRKGVRKVAGRPENGGSMDRLDACPVRSHPFAELLQRAVGRLDEHPDLPKTEPNRQGVCLVPIKFPNFSSHLLSY